MLLVLAVLRIRIRDPVPFDPWIRDPGWVESQHYPGWTTRIIFSRVSKPFFDADPGWRQFGSGMEKSRIRDKHPGSATLGFGTSSLVMGGRYQTSQTIAQLVIIFITYASIPFWATNIKANRGCRLTGRRLDQRTTHQPENFKSIKN